MQSYDSTTYAPQLQAQQQPATSGGSSSGDSLPSFELPSLPQIKAFFDSLPKPPSMGPGEPVCSIETQYVALHVMADVEGVNPPQQQDASIYPFRNARPAADPGLC